MAHRYFKLLYAFAWFCWREPSPWTVEQWFNPIVQTRKNTFQDFGKCWSRVFMLPSPRKGPFFMYLPRKGGRNGYVTQLCRCVTCQLEITSGKNASLVVALKKKSNGSKPPRSVLVLLRRRRGNNILPSCGIQLRTTVHFDYDYSSRVVLEVLRFHVRCPYYGVWTVEESRLSSASAAMSKKAKEARTTLLTYFC